MKNNFLRLLIVLTFACNTVDVKAFSIKELFNKKKQTVGCLKRVTDCILQNPADFLVGTVFLGILSIAAYYGLIRIRTHCFCCGRKHSDCTCLPYDRIANVLNNHSIMRKDHYTKYHIKTHSTYEWKTKEIKITLSRLNNINCDGSFALLRACQIGHASIIKWLIEEQFADITSIERFKAVYEAIGQENISRSLRLLIFIVGHGSIQTLQKSGDPTLLQRKAEIHNQVVATVAELTTLLDQVDQEDNDQQVQEKLQNIKKLINSKATPGFSKQLVLSDLVSLHKQYPRVITEKNIKQFYKKVAFNYTFLEDNRFRGARDFAKNNNIRDIFGRTILQSCGKHGIETQLNVISEKGYFYGTKNIFRSFNAKVLNRNLLSKAVYMLKSLGKTIAKTTKKIVNNAKNIILRKTPYIKYDGEQDILNTLSEAKKSRNKKVFRNIANTFLVMDNLKKIRFDKENHTLPDEIAAEIINFSGTDFGMKLLISDES